MAFRHLPLFYYFLALLLPSEVFNTSSVSATRAKRAASSHHPNQSSKMSIQDLAVELAKTHLLKMIVNEHAELEKAKKSVDILQRDSCTNIKSVGKPVIHNAREQLGGAWMKDPLGIMGTETIFVMESITGRKVVEEFENMDMFKAGVVRKTYKLPYNWDGTGAVVYGPYLYYNRENSPSIDKYSLRTERVEATISVSGFTARKNSYGWESNKLAGMDLAVDEQGLWVLWGSTGNSGKMYASKIDVYKNVITRTWKLDTEIMSSIANSFVVCGVIYCIDASNARTTTINFAYDTKTGKQWNPNILHERAHGVSYMVNYNPREKLLYAWDYRLQVTYSLTFEEQVPSK